MALHFLAVVSSLCILAPMASETYSLKCVQCEGLNQGDCLDKIPESTECPEDMKYCFVSGLGTGAVVRGCSSMEMNGCISVNDFEECSETCSVDDCNGLNYTTTKSTPIMSTISTTPLGCKAPGRNDAVAIQVTFLIVCVGLLLETIEDW